MSGMLGPSPNTVVASHQSPTQHNAIDALKSPLASTKSTVTTISAIDSSINTADSNMASAGDDASGTRPQAKSSASVATGAANSSKEALQPLHTATSARSNGKTSSPPADASDVAIETTMAYGTRSRNRNNNVRPNYAEDQDIDFEYAPAPVTTTTSKRKQAALDAGSASASDSKRTGDPARSANGTAAASAKDSVPANTNTTNSGPATKKRKMNNNATATGHGTSAPSGGAASGASRKAIAAAAAASAAASRENHLMTFTKHKNKLNARGELVADDGTKFAVEDYAYLVCEPPGEPYYLCRIMEFLHVRSDDPSSTVDGIRVNWYYRPRDVQRSNSDSRLVYGTMHSDVCPITSLRGRCTIKHKSEIEDLDAYRKESNSFYFIQVVDRFIRRWYECLPVSEVVNVPARVKSALDERWKFVIVEAGRVKELTAKAKMCKRCARYCASSDSVDCAECKSTYHLWCVYPALARKPTRGFAWACGPCSRKARRKLEALHTPNVSGNVTEVEEDEIVEEELSFGSNESTRAPSPSESEDDHPATQAEIALAKMWPMRYLGIHCKVEDALQYDARTIYPRASSRLGPRHQATTHVWHGRPVELVRPVEAKRKYKTGTGKYAARINNLHKDRDKDKESTDENGVKRPKWVQDAPQGYVARGEDYPNNDERNTARVMFKMPPFGEHSGRGLDDAQDLKDLEDRETVIDKYMTKAKAVSREVGVPPFGTNFLDKALELLISNNYDQTIALKKLAKVDRIRDLREPVLNRADVTKFEEGVSKYGSEHRLVHRHMDTDLPISTIVRFYYLWKKTPKGQDIWGNYRGRKGSKRKSEDDVGAQLQSEVAHEADDSGYDNDKALRKGRGFICKFCSTTRSRQWKRAPTSTGGQTVISDGKNGREKGEVLLLALCVRCAGLWRRYAIQWEDVDENTKKAAYGGGKGWKRKIDEELLREIIAADQAANQPPSPEAASSAYHSELEPVRKKLKTDSDAPKKKEKALPPPPPKEPTPPPPPPPPPPIIPAQPQWRVLPCAVCKETGNTIECAHCKLTVHRHCFGLVDTEIGESRWLCEQCQNDRNPTVSTDYACCLCLTEETQIDLVEPPRVSHKKKTDREREKERLEKELADTMRADYHGRQLQLHRPVFPREPLKRTSGNNWVHVYCAVWTPEIRFSDAKALEVAEGFQQIPMARYEATCKLCKNKDHQNRVRDDKAACVACHQCHANFHVSCAFEAGYIFGFDVTPVKSSRKDQVTTATLGEETGSVTAAIWCKEHIVKTVVHPVHEIADPTSGKTAMQVFVENYKQADLTLTGTVRKANLVQSTKEKGPQAAAAAPAATGAQRRDIGGATGIAAAVRRGARASITSDTKIEDNGYASHPVADAERRCKNCGIDVSPCWHLSDALPPHEPTPPASPGRRKSITLNDITDQIDGAVSDPQNTRFMRPGTRARAWEGVPERSGPPYMLNGDVHRDDGQNQSSTGAEKKENRTGLSPGGFLCHKCFVNRNVNPSPSPERPATSSPLPSQPRSRGRSEEKPPVPPFDPTKPVHMPQDDPPATEHTPADPLAPPTSTPSQFAAPTASFAHYASGTAAYHSPAQPLTPTQGQTLPQTTLPPPQNLSQAPHLTQPPSVIHPPTLPQGPLAPPHIGHSMHERRGSYGYTTPSQPPNPSYERYSAPPPLSTPYSTYSPHSGPLSTHLHPANGATSRSPPQPSYGSPTHGSTASYSAYAHRGPDETVVQPSQQLPPLGLPRQSSYLQSTPPSRDILYPHHVSGPSLPSPASHPHQTQHAQQPQAQGGPSMGLQIIGPHHHGNNTGSGMNSTLAPPHPPPAHSSSTTSSNAAANAGGNETGGGARTSPALNNLLL